MSDKRLFFALWPDHRQRERLRDLIGPVVKTIEGRTIDRRNWHITLAFIGEFPERRIPELLQRASTIRVEPFRVTFDRVEFWPRQRIACLAAATVPHEMQELVDHLKIVLQDEGLDVEERTFRPHVTLVRNARPFATERLTQRVSLDWSGYELLESVPEPGGVSYRIANI
jgi:2'-5' RNA ligase